MTVFTQDLLQSFTRVMGCTARELVGWLGRALPGATLDIAAGDQAGRCHARYPDGALCVEWTVLPPRRIALLEIPQLAVRFTYFDLSEPRRQEIQLTFDRSTQRGGG
jgi:hypothetical protein